MTGRLAELSAASRELEQRLRLGGGPERSERQHSQGKLVAGQVVTVEPGLYYPELGGVRLEDVALVTRNGARNLTQFEKTLEL